MIDAGLRPEKAAAVCLDFASYEEALQYFLKAVNVTDAMTHFPDLAQRRFPFAEEVREP